jgi:UDP-N-acetyl-2-amino-2-deoxyglucuronate dehydrogenase
MKAIKETGNNLIAAFDPHDSVGILDSYFPDCDFFTEFERLDRHCDKLKRQGIKIDYVVVCSPNYLHDAHIRFGLRIGADVICEKPVVLNPWNVDALIEMEKETGKKVYVIHQLRYHPAVIALKEKIDNSLADKIHTVDLQYITPRGNWYQYSWKGDEAKSGGIVTNIGLHFFDVLIWIFGNVKDSTVAVLNRTDASGKLFLEKAEVYWGLSINNRQSQDATINKPARVLTINDEQVEFSNGFTGLHTPVYEGILRGKGVQLYEAMKGISLVHKIRTS